AFDPNTRNLYIPDTSGTNGILRLSFNNANETLGTPTILVTNALLISVAPGSTAPSSLAFGPDGQLYSAMTGSTEIVRIGTPSQNNHVLRGIGNVLDTGSRSIAFSNADLWVAETADVVVIRNATLCNGACASVFFPFNLVPTAIT